MNKAVVVVVVAVVVVVVVVVFATQSTSPTSTLECDLRQEPLFTSIYHCLKVLTGFNIIQPGIKRLSKLHTCTTQRLLCLRH